MVQGWLFVLVSAILTAIACASEYPCTPFTAGAPCSVEVLCNGAYYCCGAGEGVTCVTGQQCLCTGGVPPRFNHLSVIAGSSSTARAGMAVAVTASTVVAGAYGESSSRGDAKVLDCLVDCSVATTIVASDGASSDSFGVSVAADGPLIVVGATGDSSARGAAYVFECSSASTCYQRTKLLDSGGGNSDGFGERAVVLRSAPATQALVIVSAPPADYSGKVNVGAMYSYTCSGEGMSCAQRARIAGADSAVGDQFGNALAATMLDSDTGTAWVIAGSALSDIGLKVNCGAAYVFTCSISTGACTQRAKLEAADSRGYEQFGISVAVTGTTFAVGAHYSDEEYKGQGSVYLFSCAATAPYGCTQRLQVVATDGTQDANFGRAVALYKTYLLVGAPNDNSNDGAAYLYQCDYSAWTCAIQVKLTPFGTGSTGINYGVSVALSSGAAVVGAAAYIRVFTLRCTYGGEIDACPSAAPTTVPPTTPIPTSQVPTTAQPTTPVPTTARPSTAVPTTTTPPTTAVPTSSVPPTTGVPFPEEEAPGLSTTMISIIAAGAVGALLVIGAGVALYLRWRRSSPGADSADEQKCLVEPVSGAKFRPDGAVTMN